MRKEFVKVGLWGLGAMGSGMAKMILAKEGFEITGVCDRNPDYINKSLYEILKVDRNGRNDIIVKADIDEAFSHPCELALLATDSFTQKAFPKIKILVEKKINVITTAEEMAYPKAGNPLLAEEIDRLAKANGVTVLGTGINPGMMMDLLVVALTGVMENVERVTAKRVNSLSPFGEAVMEEQGVGMTEAEFNEGMKSSRIAGHVGFNESSRMIADALGWKLSDFKQQMAPIITEVDRYSPHGSAKASNVAGVNMTAQGYVNGELKIDLYHPQQIEPGSAGIKTGDYIIIDGTPYVNMQITPEVDGGIGTIAMCVNMIPHVINSRPGLKTMLDLPVPRAIMGDVRGMIEEDL